MSSRSAALHIAMQRIGFALFALLAVAGAGRLLAQTTPATGGTASTITQSGVNYIVHSFTSGGTLTFTALVPNVEYLVIGGGTTAGPTNRGSGGGGRFVSGSATFALGLRQSALAKAGRRVPIFLSRAATAGPAKSLGHPPSRLRPRAAALRAR